MVSYVCVSYYSTAYPMFVIIAIVFGPIFFCINCVGSIVFCNCFWINCLLHQFCWTNCVLQLLLDQFSFAGQIPILSWGQSGQLLLLALPMSTSARCHLTQEQSFKNFNTPLFSYCIHLLHKVLGPRYLIAVFRKAN